MKKTSLIIFMVFIIVSASSISFAAYESVLSKKYENRYSRSFDRYLTQDQQEKIANIKTEYIASIEEAVNEVREIRFYFMLVGATEGSVTYEDLFDQYPQFDPVLTNILKEVIWEKRVWLYHQRKAFDDNVRKVAPNIPYYILKVLI